MAIFRGRFFRIHQQIQFIGIITKCGLGSVSNALGQIPKFAQTFISILNGFRSFKLELLSLIHGFLRLRELIEKILQ